MSFQDVRTALVLSYGDGQIDDEEFALLYDAYKSTNPAYPYWEFGDFCWEEYDSSEFEAMFRVKQEDIPILVGQGTICDGIEGLCILLKRYSIHNTV